MTTGVKTRPSLFDYLLRVEDHRDARGRRHPLQAILGLVCCAAMAGAQGLRATAQWGRQHAAEVAAELGFTRKPPCFSTLHYVLGRLNVAAFEAAISAWIADAIGRPVALAMDGKTMRGSRDGEVPGVHLLSAFAAEFNAVLAQVRVDAKTNEAKTILELLRGLPIAGVTITLDAAFTQRAVCQKIVDSGGDYVVAVKENQPNLRKDVEDMFAPAFSPLGSAAV